MADINSHQMKVGLGYSVDTSALQALVDMTNQINEASKEAAEGLKGITKAAEGASKSNWLSNLKKERDAGLKEYDKYKNELIKKDTELKRRLKEEQGKAQREQQNSYQKTLNEYAAVHKEMTRITQTEAKQQAQAVQQMTNQSISNFKALGKEIDKLYGSKRTIGENILNSMVTYGVLRQVTGEFNKLGSAISDINYNVINNQRLMGDFSIRLRESLNDAATEIARNTGITITDAQKIQGAWIRINDEYAKNAELLNDISLLTAKFMNVGEIENAEEAVTLLNASLLQFNVSAADAIEKSEEFLNKWAYMADKTAMGTADEYGEAISRFAAQLKALNGDMDDAIALASIMADRLAKSGEEAGTSLKTITTYLSREKTLKLFSTIAEDLGDTSYNLVDVNGRMKDFDSILRTVAQAYKIYKDAGNDAMAQTILESIGATRQRDAALAILNSVNDGSYDEYINKMSSDEVNGYIEDQNAALMEAFQNQYNAFVAALQSSASKIASSGLIQGITLLMNGFEGLLTVIGKIPTPMLMVANGFLAFKTGLAGLNKISEITGLSDKLWQSLRLGTQEQIKNASAIQATTTALLEREKASMAVYRSTLGGTEAYKTQTQALSTFASGCEELALSYKNGSINAQEYSSMLESLTNSYYDTVLLTEQSAIAHGEEAAAQQLSASTSTNMRIARQSTNAVNRESLLLLLQEKALLVANTGLQKAHIGTTVAEAAAKAKLKVTEIATNVVRALSGTLIKKQTTQQKALNLAELAGVVAGKAMTGVMTLLGAALNLVLNPMVLLGVAFTVLTTWMQSSSQEAQKLDDEINDLNSQLDDTKSRLEELRALERKGGLTSGEKAELRYLEEKNDLLEKSINLKKQEKYNDLWEDTGGWFGIGKTEGSKEWLDDILDEYKAARASSIYYSDYLKDTTLTTEQAATYNDLLSESNEKLRSSAADLITEYYDLKDLYDSGVFTGKVKTEVEEYLNEIEGLMPQLSMLVEGYQNLSDTISTLSDETEAYTEDIEGLKGKVSDLNDLFDEYNKQGYLSYETVSELIAEHPEYVKYLVKVGDQYKLNKVAENELNDANQEIIETTDDMIAKLGEETVILQTLSQDMIDAIDAVDYFTIGIRDTFGDIDGVDKFVDDLREINVSLLKGEISIEDYNAAMNNLIDSLDFSRVNEDISTLDENGKKLVQSQQAIFTSLAQEISNYMMEVTNALFRGEMSATEYVNALKGSNQNLLDMYVASKGLTLDQKKGWVDSTGAVNEYANSLQGVIDGLDGISEATQFLQDHQSTLAELQENTANGMVDNAWWAAYQNSEAYKAMATDFSNVMANMYANNYDAWWGIVRTVASANEVSVDDIVDANGYITEYAQGNAEIMASFTTATMNAVSTAVNKAATAAGDVLVALGDMIKNFEYTIKFTPQADLKFDASKILTGENPFSGSGLKLKITGEGGDSVTDFANSLNTFGSSLKDIDFSTFFGDIGNYTPRDFTSKGSSYIPSDYSGSSSDRDTAATRNPTGSSGKSDAEKAAEEALKAIEKLIKEYTKNVETMYDRIAKSLKKKYQEQYNERKKLLEKEHNERVEQIQAEIDALNGNRKEDKESKLEELNRQYQLWLQDNSTLGKARQKELLEQIEELEKEIKIDELEAKLDEENENYKNSIDSESEFYDAMLKKLDEQMTDEALYREAADLIRNEKTQQIIDLLTEYDAQWDGWATLMGQTAGEIIAEEVALALANYKDVKDGTVTENGGKNTNALTGNTTPSTTTTSSTSSTGSDNSKSHTIKSGDTLWALAEQYYGDGSKWTKIQKANGGIDPYSLTIGKKLIIPFATGGYTGTAEGIAYLHKKERVLNAQQTSAFDALVYDFLPTIQKELLNPNGGSDTINNNNGNTFNKELVSVHVDKVINNTPYDIQNSEDNLDRMFRQSLRKSGINFKR